MTYAAHNMDFLPCFGQSASKPGVLRRAINHIRESRQRQADREIARFLDRSGGRLTDELEREMTQRAFQGNWSPRPL